MNCSDFEDISLDALQRWVATGDDSKIPEVLQKYMTVLDIARSMYDKYKSKAVIVNTLTKSPYGLSIYMSNRVFSDALNFFYSDNQVKAKAWRTIYADRLDNLAILAIAQDNTDTAQRCMLEACKLRLGNEDIKEIPAEMYARPTVIYSMKAEDVGFKSTDRRKLAKFIDTREGLTEDDRKRLHRDIGNNNEPIFDVDVTEIDNIVLNEDQ